MLHNQNISFLPSQVSLKHETPLRKILSIKE
jgi:hypothetical protein